MHAKIDVTIDVDDNETEVPVTIRPPRTVSMRDHWLSNTIFTSYDDIVDHGCRAWNNLVKQPQRITTIGLRQWAHG